jgi:hypothetical protein
MPPKSGFLGSFLAALPFVEYWLLTDPVRAHREILPHEFCMTIAYASNLASATSGHLPNAVNRACIPSFSCLFKVSEKTIGL